MPTAGDGGPRARVVRVPRALVAVGVHQGVRLGDQPGQGIAALQLGQPEGDRCLVAGGQVLVDAGEPLGGVVHVQGRESADELVAAVAHDQVVGAHIGPQGVGDLAQEAVARDVAVEIVAHLEVVHVDEGEHEGVTGPVRPGDLVLELQQPGVTAVGPGQPVHGRLDPLVRRHDPVQAGGGPVGLGMEAVAGGGGAIPPGEHLRRRSSSGSTRPLATARARASLSRSAAPASRSAARASRAAARASRASALRSRAAARSSCPSERVASRARRVLASPAADARRRATGTRSA